MIDEAATRLRRQADFSIWMALRQMFGHTARSFKSDALASVSRTALHYGLGGAMDALSLDTIALRSGLQLGAIRAGNGGRP